MSKPLKFLTTSEISCTGVWGVPKPLRDKAVPVAWLPEDSGYGKDAAVYSRGRVEEAQADGFQVVVLSSRPQFGTHDAWWLKLVGSPYAHAAGRTISGSGQMRDLFLQAVAIYGIDWPRDINGALRGFREGLDIINAQQAEKLRAFWPREAKSD